MGTEFNLQIVGVSITLENFGSGNSFPIHHGKPVTVPPPLWSIWSMVLVWFWFWKLPFNIYHSLRLRNLCHYLNCITRFRSSTSMEGNQPTLTNYCNKCMQFVYHLPSRSLCGVVVNVNYKEIILKFTCYVRETLQLSL